MTDARGVYAVESAYEAVPMSAAPGREMIVSKIIRKTCDVESVFNDYTAACEEKCYVEKARGEMCDACGRRFDLVLASLLRPDAFIWEVWKDTPEMPELVGIIRFGSVRPGEDATGHYVFFDGDLRGKTSVLRSVIAWAFSDHPEMNWRALRRLTIEIPDFAYALARHASRKLGFGGPFRYKLRAGGPGMQVEGVKPGAILWRGERRDVLVLGLTNASV